MRPIPRSFLGLATGLALAASVPAAAQVEIDSSTFGGLEARSIGPAVMSGRIAAIDGVAKDPLTFYVGAAGGGVWKSTDAGTTFKSVFDDQTQSIGAVRIDPRQPRNVWVGTGESWTRNSVSIGDGVYRSTDGGETWRKIEKGLPAGDKGRIALAVAPSRTSVVYAVVESKDTALYRSEDLGESWERVNSSFNVQARPFYFAHVVVDPTDHNRVYKPGLTLTMSEDGGRNFNSSMIPSFAGPHADHHALWINPHNPYEMILGTDGGAYISQDRGNRWRHVKSLPISQFYRVSADMAYPYNVQGGLQDNGSWRGPSRGSRGIQNRDWQNIGSGDGFYSFRDPLDADLVYSEYQGGQVSRLRLSTGESRDIKPLEAAGDPPYRFNWNTPIHLSPNDPGTMYIGAQFLFRTRDRGESWEKISPDLSTNNPALQRQLQSGGLTVDNSDAENHTTIYAISESPKNRDVIWAGTDDGNLQVTRDGGKTWTNVAANLAGVPKGTWVSSVDASPHDEATAFATLDGHTRGDMKTYVFKTTDFGKTWTALATAATEGYAHIIRQDPEHPGLLFLGTELGLFISVDGGARWARFTGGFPDKVAVRDLALHPRDHDLVIATHGRGIYIVDDISPLRHACSASSKPRCSGSWTRSSDGGLRWLARFPPGSARAARRSWCCSAPPVTWPAASCCQAATFSTPVLTLAL